MIGSSGVLVVEGFLPVTLVAGTVLPVVALEDAGEVGVDFGLGVAWREGPNTLYVIWCGLTSAMQKPSRLFS